MDAVYAADDRTRDEKDAPDGNPDLAALRNLWVERDRRYSLRKAELNAGQVASVRAWRIRETRDLPVAERAAGFREAMSWVAPLVVVS